MQALMVKRQQEDQINKYIYKYINMHIYANEPRRNKFEGVSGSGPIGGKSIKTCRPKMNATPV